MPTDTPPTPEPSPEARAAAEGFAVDWYGPRELWPRGAAEITAPQLVDRIATLLATREAQARAAGAATGREAVRQRDLLWSQALLATLDTRDAERVVAWVNAHRPDPDPALGPTPPPAVPTAGLQAVLAEVVEWARQTFGRKITREHFLAAIRHLRKEVEEVEAAANRLGGQGLAEEVADCVMILSHIAADAGVDLAEAIRDKLAVCRTRTWQAPDADGVVEHARDQAPTPQGPRGGAGA